MCGCGCRPGVMGILGKAAWLVVGLAALNIGLAAFMNFDFWKLEMIANNAGLVRALMLVVGLSGAWCLFTFSMAAMHCMSGKCSECK